MSCNCGNHHSHPPIPPGHDCSHINHVFDPNPPAFYGTWKHMSGFDPNGKVSVCQPGIESGLYSKGGPLNCNCGCASLYSLTGVKTTARIILEVSLSYSNPSKDKSIILQPGNVYLFTYLEDGELKDCCGLLTNIYKVEGLESKTNLYKIRVDCSTSYGANVVVFKTDQIRGVEEYKNYMFEPTKLSDCTAKNGSIVSAIIKDAIVINAEVDKYNNIIRGDIIYGILENGKMVDAIVKGTNENGHILVMVDAPCYGGEIVSGKILNGVLKSGDVDGVTEEGTGITTQATLKGIITNAVIQKAVTKGGYTNEGEGTLIDPTIDNGNTYGGTITGTTVTTGGVTSGNITTGGTTVTTDGTVIGGVTIGEINGRQFKIENGTTKGTFTTTGGVVVGGTVTGGQRIGNTIYNATVTGGTVTGGITTGGTTTVDLSIGDITPATADDIIIKTTEYDPNQDTGKRTKIRNDVLWIGEDRITHEPWTNIATTTIGKVVDPNT